MVTYIRHSFTATCTGQTRPALSWSTTKYKMPCLSFRVERPKLEVATASGEWRRRCVVFAIYCSTIKIIYHLFLCPHTALSVDSHFSVIPILILKLFLFFVFSPFLSFLSCFIPFYCSPLTRDAFIYFKITSSLPNIKLLNHKVVFYLKKKKNIFFYYSFFLKKN